MPKFHFEVSATPQYQPEESAPAAGVFHFVYTITIRNSGKVPARLVRRHWLITDGEGHTEEVHGDGVVGEQPWLRPGDGFQYVSGVVLGTTVGTMRGSYDIVADDGTEFAAKIPEFTLTIPRTLH